MFNKQDVLQSTLIEEIIKMQHAQCECDVHSSHVVQKFLHFDELCDVKM
jgi:ABC-type Na+ transport system ATPase subunit NatA